MPEKYRIKLSESERLELEKISRLQRVAASKKQRARIFLLSDENSESGALKDTEIAERVGMSLNSIERIRGQCHEMGPLDSLERKKRAVPPREVIIDGELEARLLAEACSEPPEGCARWTLRLLAKRLVELKLVDGISPETVRAALKKTNFSLTGSNTGASPKTQRRVRSRDGGCAGSLCEAPGCEPPSGMSGRVFETVTQSGNSTYRDETRKSTARGL